MANLRIRSIRIVKGDNVFHVHGALAGAEGVFLAKGQVHGLYDAPIKTTYKHGAFQEGSTHRQTQKPHRDLELGFHIKDTFNQWELNDSLFRQMFESEEDQWDPSPNPTTIVVETDLSGIRMLDVLMYEEPEFTPDLDPMGNQFGNIIFKLRAPDPMWYEDTVVDSFTDTASASSGFVTVENPTNNIMRQKWVLTEGNWALPDFQWVGAKGARAPGGDNGARIVDGIIVTSGNGGATVDLDRMNLMFRDANNTNILGQLGPTRIFVYPIPPYTPPTLLPVGYSGAPSGGAMVQLRMPLRWSRPWGLEIPTEDQLTTPRAVESVITAVGPYTYHIPAMATHVDVILLGGGGGGDGAQSFNIGGGAGSWWGATLERGVDIPWDTEVITGSVGGGGGPGGFIAPFVSVRGSAGQESSANAIGMTSLSGGGGLGGGVGGGVGGTSSGPGPSPQVLSFNGRNYYAGGGSGLSVPGQSPGGGGSGGLPFANGFPGARGQVWFYAYHVA